MPDPPGAVVERLALVDALPPHFRGVSLGGGFDHEATGGTDDSRVEIGDRDVVVGEDDRRVATSPEAVLPFDERIGPALEPSLDGDQHPGDRRQRGQLRVGARGRATGREVELEVEVTTVDSATAIFRQTYSSDTMTDQVRKTLELRREGEAWKIVRETSVPLS